MSLTDEFTKHRRAAIAVWVLIALIVLALYAEPLANQQGDATLAARRATLVSLANMPNYVLSGLAAVGPFVMILFGAAVMAAEFRWRTAAGQVARLTARGWLLRKLAFASLVLTVALVEALLLGVVASLVTVGMVGRGAEPAPDPVLLLARLATTWVGLAVWLTASMLLAVLLRSAIAAVVLTVAYAYAETMLAPLLGPVGQFLPATAQVGTLQVFDHLPDVGLVGPPQLPPGLAWAPAVLLVVAALAIAVAAYLVLGSRREYGVSK